jgi:ATP-dependent DNA ligase
MSGADWSKRYPLIVESAARIDRAAIIDTEVIRISPDGVADFDALHSRMNDRAAAALAFDLLALDGEDLRRKPFSAAENPEADTAWHSICRAYRRRQ